MYVCAQHSMTVLTHRTEHMLGMSSSVVDRYVKAPGKVAPSVDGLSPAVIAWAKMAFEREKVPFQAWRQDAARCTCLEGGADGRVREEQLAIELWLGVAQHLVHIPLYLHAWARVGFQSVAVLWPVLLLHQQVGGTDTQMQAGAVIACLGGKQEPAVELGLGATLHLAHT